MDLRQGLQRKSKFIATTGAKMAELEVLRSMVKSFRLIELRNLMLFAGQSKLGRKVELLARALELITSSDDKIAMKIRELSGEMYKGPNALTGAEDKVGEKEPQKKVGPAVAAAAAATAAVIGNGTDSSAGTGGSAPTTGNNTEEDEGVPLSASLATKKSKKSKDRDKSKKSKKKKKDKKKHKSPSKKKQIGTEDRYDPKHKSPSK